MAAPQQSAPRLRAAYWVTFGFFLLYIALALLCLRQWSSPRPWQHVDAIVAAFFVISFAWMLQSLDFHKVVFHSKEMMQEASGAGYDPWMLRAFSFLPLLDLLVYYEYAHWQLTPALRQPLLHGLGLALAAGGVGWLWWTDRHLTRHFRGDTARRSVIHTGPYRWVRHPRYLGLLIWRAAFALAFASPLAWMFSLPWLAMILRRIRLEEAHLHGIFGPAYAEYSKHTSRLLPRVF